MGRGSVDWVGFVEAANASDLDDNTWADGVLALAGRIFATVGDTRFLGIVSIVHGRGPKDLRVAFDRSTSLHAGRAPTYDFEYTKTIASLGAAAIRALWYPPTLVAKQTEVVACLPRAGEILRAYRKEYDCEESIGLVVHPTTGKGTCLYAGFGKEPTLTRHARRTLTQIALHLETALRARSRPLVVIAVVRPDGKILHRTESAPSQLDTHVKRIERARTRRLRSAPEGLDLWNAIVEGRASIVERIDGGQRLYFVIENAPASQSFHALAREEVEAVSYATRGLSSKLVAYALGVSEGEVSARLSRASRKVGLATRLELVRLAALLTRDPNAGLEDASFTPAERDVLQLLREGLSNREIATIRHRSIRTIANQVASLLRKTNTPTRRVLAAS